MSCRAVRAHPSDDVATLLESAAAGCRVEVEDERAGSGAGERLLSATDIPAYHKIALRAITAGQPVVKYGEVIGRASADIPAGAHVHVHNVESLRGRREPENRGAPNHAPEPGGMRGSTARGSFGGGA